MIHLFKYDVAISFAEEDDAVANLIARALHKKGVRYYYYKEQPAGSWGEYIIQLTRNAYGKRTRFVLLLISKHFAIKYTSGIELQIALASRRRILPLRLDNTIIPGISNHMVFLLWKNNPEEIADLICQKISLHKVFERRLVRSFMVTLIMALLIFVICMFPGAHVNEPVVKKVMVTSPSDSFYISNTEVTVAEYRKFCEEQKINMPPQLPSAYEDGPVVNVTWYEAMAYCKWVGGRLPSEAEWYYAAGAGLSVKYSGGNNAARVAVYNRKKPSYVMSRIPNTFDLYDMTGNVAEWCIDSLTSERPVRGGAYNSKINPVNELAIAYRTEESPDARKPYIGFRVVWEVKQ